MQREVEDHYAPADEEDRADDEGSSEGTKIVVVGAAAAAAAAATCSVTATESEAQDKHEAAKGQHDQTQLHPQPSALPLGDGDNGEENHLQMASDTAGEAVCTATVAASLESADKDDSPCEDTANSSTSSEIKEPQMGDIDHSAGPPQSRFYPVNASLPPIFSGYTDLTPFVASGRTQMPAFRNSGTESVQVPQSMSWLQISQDTTRLQSSLQFHPSSSRSMLRARLSASLEHNAELPSQDSMMHISLQPAWTHRIHASSLQHSEAVHMSLQPTWIHGIRSISGSATQRSRETFLTQTPLSRPSSIFGIFSPRPPQSNRNA